MKLNHSALILVWIFLTSTAQVLAQEAELKNLVWQDCEKALQAVKQLSGEQQQPAVSFLFEVVRLKIIKHEPKFAFQPELVKAPVGLLDQVSLAQSLTPEDLLKPKQCALSLLQFMPQSAQLVLPELLKISQDQTEDLILRLRIQEAALEIGKALKECNYTANCIKNDILKDIIDKYFQDQSEIAKQIITLFSDQVLKILIGDIESLSCMQTDCGIIKNRLELLSTLDFKSTNIESNNLKSTIAQLLLNLLQQIQVAPRIVEPQAQINILENPQDQTKEESSDYSKLKLLVTLQGLAKTPQLYEQLLTFLLEHLNPADSGLVQVGIKPEEIYDLLNLIFRYESENLSLVIDPNLRLKLFDILANSPVLYRDSLEQGLLPLTASGQIFESKLEELSKSKDIDLRFRAAKLAGLVRPKSKTVESLLGKLIIDKDIKVQVAAIKASSDSSLLIKHSKSIEVLASKLYKLATASLMDLSAIVDLSFQLIFNLKPELVSKQVFDLVWLLANKTHKDLNYKNQFIEFNNLILKQDKFLATKLKLKSKTKEQKLLEIHLLSQLPQSENNVEHIQALLNDQDLQIVKEVELILLGKQNLPKLLIQTKKLSQVLAAEFVANKQSDSISNLINCSDYQEYINSCRSKSSKGNFCANLIKDSLRCYDKVDFSNWTTADLDIFINADVLRFRNNLDEAKNLYFICPLIESALHSNLIVEQDYPAVCETLNSLTCKSLMPQVLLDNKLAASCYSLIKQSFENASETETRSQLFRILTQIDSNSINISTIFNDALERKDFSLLKQLIDSTLLDQMVLHLKQVLSSDLLTAQELILALDLLEDIGSRAESLLPDIIKLSLRSELFYESSRAIISVATNNTSLRVETLKKLIGSIVFPRLVKDLKLNNLSVTANAIIESESLIKLSYLEKRDLNSLLAKLSGETVVHQEAF